MKLIIDIGNTRTKLGFFAGESLRKKAILEKGWRVKDLEQAIGRRSIDQVALSTVAGLDKEIENYLNENYPFLILSADTPLPITNGYKTPRTLGKDRLAVAIAAAHLFPGQHSLVIDAGTCITYDFVENGRIYQGGSITPGINLRLKGMNAFTASLPLVKTRKLTSTIGKDTITSIRTGAQLGAALEMEGFIRHYESMFGSLQVLLTGGDANYFAKQLKTKIFVNLNLVLIGLNKILDYNVQHLE